MEVEGEGGLQEVEGEEVREGGDGLGALREVQDDGIALANTSLWKREVSTKEKKKEHKVAQRGRGGEEEDEEEEEKVDSHCYIFINIRKAHKGKERGKRERKKRKREKEKEKGGGEELCSIRAPTTSGSYS